MAKLLEMLMLILNRIAKERNTLQIIQFKTSTMKNCTLFSLAILALEKKGDDLVLCLSPFMSVSAGYRTSLVDSLSLSLSLSPFLSLFPSPS
jgi:hypothetical protein